MIAQNIPGAPYGDPNDNWKIAEGDFYRFADEAFDLWHEGQEPKSNMGSCDTCELTARQPEGHVVAWKDRKFLRREDQRKVHPDVAAEAERLDAIERPSKEDVSRMEFSPSPLACFRAGFSEGVSREKQRANADWGRNLEKYADARDGWVVMGLKRTVQSKGADYAREMLESVLAELEAEA